MRQHWFRTCVSAFVSAGLCSVLAIGTTVAAGAISREEAAAEAFVVLTLRLGAMPGHEEEVDSYFGPEALRPVAQNDSLAQLRADAHALLSRVKLNEAALPTPRGSRLLVQIRSFDSLLEVVGRATAPGESFEHGGPAARVVPNPAAGARVESFEDEAQRLYGRSVPGGPQPAAAHQTLTALATELPGSGPLSQRVADFYRDFIVPPDRRRLVFERALRECRSRTLSHWQLPREEKLDVEWTESVPAAWHRYRGGWHSTLQINPDAVALPGSAIDVACHEAYPGHHAQFLLQDRRAQPAGLPVEDRVVLLRSPASVLREGAANFGVELAFPFEERVAFEEHVLFPLAHLDSRQARRYETVHRLVDQLSAAAAPIIAAYRDHRLSRDDAEQQLGKEALVTSPGALLEFADHYGAYVLGYTAVRDSVRDYVLAQKRDDWSVLRELVADPYGTRDLIRRVQR